MSLPNILFIICHDLGRYLGCYGRASIESPNLDRLADEGVRFEHHFCAAPSCSPSRGSIMTGRYPHTNGLMGLVNLGWELPFSETTMPEYLLRAGYETYLFGVQHERRDPRTLGYDHVDASKGTSCVQVGQAVTEFLLTGPREPFFANVGVVEVHRPFRSAELAGVQAAVHVPSFLPDNPQVLRDMMGFAQLVRRLDTMVGSLLATLETTGLARNTLVVFTTDHGIDMPRAKGTLYDPGLEVSLIMRWPGTIRPGRTTDALLGHVDLLPTLMQAAGLAVPPEVQGKSFLPLLAGTGGQGREAVFTEKTHHCQYDPMRCVRTARYKYIHNFGPLRPIEIPADVEMDVIASAPELYVQRRPATELYDLQRDPLESHNLCGDPAYSQIEAGLKERLRAWMEETDDPLLEGLIPLPRDVW